jgi:PAS domain S-box-containing protein
MNNLVQRTKSRVEARRDVPRKREYHQEKQADQEQLYRIMVERSFAGVYIVQDGLFSYLNINAADYAGYAPAELIGSKANRIVHPEDREFVKANALAMLRHKRNAPYEFRIVAKDGRIRWILETVAFIMYQGRLAILGNSVNITDRKQKEWEWREKSAEMERFTFAVSHDLKCPLTTVKTFMEYLEQDIAGADTDRIREDLVYVNMALDKMMKLLDELLDMSRADSVVTPPVRITLRELAEDALNASAGRIAAGKVRVRVDNGARTLFGDRPRLARIWQNLVDNAVKFMGSQASPRIEIGADDNGAGTVFFVRDNGIGIVPQDQSKVFGMFEKLDPKSGGTGMGLALIKRIVNMHRGNIWLESDGPGQGACFRFTLPDAVNCGQAHN